MLIVFSFSREGLILCIFLIVLFAYIFLICLKTMSTFEFPVSSAGSESTIKAAINAGIMQVSLYSFLF